MLREIEFIEVRESLVDLIPVIVRAKDLFRKDKVESHKKERPGDIVNGTFYLVNRDLITYKIFRILIKI